MQHYRIQRQGLPIGDAADPHSFSTWFCGFVVTLPHPFFHCDHHFSTLLRPSQLFSIFATLFNSSQISSLPTSAQLFSHLPCSSQLFSMTLTSAHLVWTLLNSSQLFSPLVTSSTLPTSYHLRSTHLTSFSAHLNSSHLLNSGQLFSTLLTSCHRDAYTQSKLYTEKHLHTASSYTEKLFIDRSVYAQQAFTHSKLLHREAFTRRKLSHREAFTQTQSKLFHRASFCTEKLLHKASFYTQQFFTQRSFTLSSYTKRSFYTEKILHRASFFTAQDFAQRKFLHREGFTQSKLLHREAFTHSMLLHRSCYTGCAKIVRNICCQSNIRDLRFWAAKDAKSILHAAAAPGCSGDWVAKHTRISHNSYTHCTSETGSTPKRKNDDFEALFKRNFTRKIISTKMKKNLLPKRHSQLSCCHYNTIYDRQLEDTRVLRTHPQQRTLTQPFHCDLQRLSCKTHFCTAAKQIAAPKPDFDAQAEKRRFWSTF